MRKITEESVTAFIDGENLNKQNMNVYYNQDTDSWGMRLHGNLIAIRYNETGETFITHADWQTVTTKERLNGLLQLMGSKLGISQKNFQWYFVDEKLGRIRVMNTPGFYNAMTGKELSPS